MRYLPTLLLVLLGVGCSRGNDTMTRFHEDGRAKPVVAIAPMIDTTTQDASWSLSEEITSMIVQRMGQGGKLFVVSNEDDSFTDNPFGPELGWVKREFHDQEFVVFLELVEHEAVAANKLKKNLPPQEVSTNLNMAVRIRVLDLRSATPKVVLQEMIRDTYFIPKTLIPTDYTSVVWGSDTFLTSPMGIAHTQLVQEIVSRVSDYILLAKSQ
jgi:hypothetical protein